MRLSKVLLLLMLAAGMSGCASLPPPRMAATPPPAPAPTTAWAASLDGRAYGEPAPLAIAPVATPAQKPTPFTALARLFERGHPAPVAVAAPLPQQPIATVGGPSPQGMIPPAVPVAVKPTPFTALAQLFERGRPAPVALVAAPAPAGVVAVPAVVEDVEVPYTLDTGDRLRIVVFGQEGLTNSYVVDAQGKISMPLIGAIDARAHTTEELSHLIADRLRRGFIREPHVSIEVEIYRPFFILGEVTAPGQYPYVPNMTIETAVAIAGGFTPRAYRWDIHLDRPAAGGVVRRTVPALTRVRPGDTITVKERWF
jgi:polysaccharide biosynthesis/export protein